LITIQLGSKKNQQQMVVYIEQRLFVVNNEGTRYNMHIAYCQGKTQKKLHIEFSQNAFQKNTLMCVYT